MDEIRPLVRADALPASAMLARAFCDNPGYAVGLDHLRRDARLRAVERLKRGFVRAYVGQYEADAVWRDGRLGGVSLVLPPGRHPVSPVAWLRIASGGLTIGLRGAQRMAMLDAYMRGLHPHELHYYLFVLGVEPDLQGLGLGKLLLRALNARADSRGVPCYLETDKATSVRLYESVGYRVVTEGEVAAVGNLRMWTMRRPVGGRD